MPLEQAVRPRLLRAAKHGKEVYTAHARFHTNVATYLDSGFHKYTIVSRYKGFLVAASCSFSSYLLTFSVRSYKNIFLKKFKLSRFVTTILFKNPDPDRCKGENKSVAVFDEDGDGMV